jgi:protein tyrosine phosphatase (PTP) superfamily phosphohydrolase (DUF442 family)
MKEYFTVTGDNDVQPFADLFNAGRDTADPGHINTRTMATLIGVQAFHAGILQTEVVSRVFQNVAQPPMDASEVEAFTRAFDAAQGTMASTNRTGAAS